MRHITAQVFAILIAVTASRADATVGFQHFSINDPQGPPIEVGVWYPTAAEPKLEAIESNQQIVAHDAAVEVPAGLWSSYRTVTEAPMPDISTPPWRWPMRVSSPALTHNGDSWNDQSNPTAIGERPRQFKLPPITCWANGAIIGALMRTTSAHSASPPAASRC